MAFEIVLLALAVLILLAGGLAFFAFKIQREEYARTGKRPKGHYMGIGMAVGVAIGVSLGAASDMLAIGPAMGVALGAALGAVMEKRHAHELRPLSPREVEMRKKLILFLLFTSLLGLAAFFYFSMLG